MNLNEITTTYRHDYCDPQKTLTFYQSLRERADQRAKAALEVQDKGDAKSVKGTGETGTGDAGSTDGCCGCAAAPAGAKRCDGFFLTTYRADYTDPKRARFGRVKYQNNGVDHKKPKDCGQECRPVRPKRDPCEQVNQGKPKGGACGQQVEQGQCCYPECICAVAPC